jgi:hypothetical protein
VLLDLTIQLGQIRLSLFDESRALLVAQWLNRSRNPGGSFLLRGLLGLFWLDQLLKAFSKSHLAHPTPFLVPEPFILDIGGIADSVEYFYYPQTTVLSLRNAGCGLRLLLRVLDLTKLDRKFSVHRSPADKKHDTCGRQYGGRTLKVEKQVPAKRRARKLSGYAFVLAHVDEGAEDG